MADIYKHKTYNNKPFKQIHITIIGQIISNIWIKKTKVSTTLTGLVRKAVMKL